MKKMLKQVTVFLVLGWGLSQGHLMKIFEIK